MIHNPNSEGLLAEIDSVIDETNELSDAIHQLSRHARAIKQLVSRINEAVQAQQDILVKMRRVAAKSVEASVAQGTKSSEKKMKRGIVKVKGHSDEAFNAILGDDGVPHVEIRNGGGNLDGVYMLVTEVEVDDAVEERVVGVFLEDPEEAEDALDDFMTNGCYLVMGRVVRAMEFLKFLEDRNDFHIPRQALKGKSPEEAFRHMTAQDLLNEYGELF